MIKMADFFKGRRRVALVAGLVCLIVLSGALLTRGLTRQDSTYSPPVGLSYNAEKLFQCKTPYVGDSSRVVNLIDNLPFSEMRREVSLQTLSTPYGVTVNYDFSGVGTDAGLIKSVLRDNAAVMLVLIDNVDTITFNVKAGIEPTEYRYARAEAQNSRDADLREYAKDIESLQRFLNSLSFRLHVYPEKYALIMSSTPGMRIAAEYRDPTARVRYSAGEGSLFSWDVPTGKISKSSPTIEIPVDTAIYWSPLDQNDQDFVADKTLLTATLLDGQGQKIDERRVTILFDGSMYYTVQPAIDIDIEGYTWVKPQKPKDLNEAVGMAVKSRGHSYYAGETLTEGHVILDSEESGGGVKVYTIASVGNFGFENGVFTKISGSGAIPTVMTYSRNENSEYTLLQYKEPMDGTYYIESIKKMFPKKLQDRVLSSQGDYADLVRQQEAQAAEYLKSIGREAKVSAAHVEKQLVSINVEASNKLFAGYTKYDQFLNDCPYWVGTREQIENGVRYIYETSQGKTSGGYDLVVFRKTREGGAVVEERQYKIVGSEPVLLER